MFLCEKIDGEFETGVETIAVDCFNFEDLPKLSTAQTNKKHIAGVHQHLNYSSLLTTIE